MKFLYLIIFLHFNMFLFSQNLENGLQGWYRLNNNLIDRSINEIQGNGFQIEPAIGLEGFENSCFVFNGSNSFINLSVENRNVTDEVSVSAWVKSFDEKRQFIVSKYNSNEDKGYFLALDDGFALIGGRLSCGNFYQCISTSKLNDGEWHHITGIVKGGIYEIWVDCVLENTLKVTCDNIDLTCSHPLTFGSWYETSDNGNGRFFNGSIDEIRLYNRQLTEDEIGILCNILIVDTEEIENHDNGLNIYPNPTKNQLFLNSAELSGNNLTYKIFDLHGRLVSTGITANSIVIDKDLNGYHFLQIFNSNNLVHLEKILFIQ